MFVSIRFRFGRHQFKVLPIHSDSDFWRFFSEFSGMSLLHYYSAPFKLPTCWQLFQTTVANTSRPLKLCHSNHYTSSILYILHSNHSVIYKLLLKTASIPFLHDSLILNDCFLVEWHIFPLRWLPFSSQWPQALHRHSSLNRFQRFYKGKWFASKWPSGFRSHQTKSITSSSCPNKLYPHYHCNNPQGSQMVQEVNPHNISLVEIINEGHSHTKKTMQFLRRLTLVSFRHQFLLCVEHDPET